MLKLEATNLNSLFSQSMDKLMNDPTTHDAAQTPRLLSYNNLLFASSLDFEFDLSHTGFTKTRWARYVHQYLDKEQLEIWLDNLKYISKRGDNLFRSKDAVRRYREHAHGSCWLGLSYRSTPPTLVLYSRVAEFPTRAALELTLCHPFCWPIMNIPLGDMVYLMTNEMPYRIFPSVCRLQNPIVSQPR